MVLGYNPVLTTDRIGPILIKRQRLTFAVNLHKLYLVLGVGTLLVEIIDLGVTSDKSIKENDDVTFEIAFIR